MSRDLEQPNRAPHLHVAPAILYTLYLPLYYKDGSAVPSHVLTQIQRDLWRYSGGLTRFPPAVGLWKPSSSPLVRDVVEPIQVVVAGGQASEEWFAHKTEELAIVLGQDHIFCVLQPVQSVESSLILPSTNGSPPIHPHDALTGREREVLILAANGKMNKEIALALGIAEHTVEVHFDHLFRKLKVSSRTEAVIHAVRLGIIAFPK
jgi:DNA-binding CsgD family transcriptional regulator